MTLGKRIKVARERLVPKLTQLALAEKLGVTDKAVSSWERDKTLPEHAKIPELRRILKVTYAWLWEGKDPPSDPDAPEVLFHELAPAERAAVRAVIESFHKRRGKVA